MSLRLRLLLAVGAVALTALAVADVVTYQELRSFLYSRIDQSLEQSHQPIDIALGSGPHRGVTPGSSPSVGPTGQSGPPQGLSTNPTPASGSASPPPCAGFAGLTSDLMHELQPGTFVEIRSSSNAILCRSTQPELGSNDSDSPRLPTRITGFVSNASDFGEATVYFTVQVVAAATRSTGSGRRCSKEARTPVDSSWSACLWRERRPRWAVWSGSSWPWAEQHSSPPC